MNYIAPGQWNFILPQYFNRLQISFGGTPGKNNTHFFKKKNTENFIARQKKIVFFKGQRRGRIANVLLTTTLIFTKSSGGMISDFFRINSKKNHSCKCFCLEHFFIFIKKNFSRKPAKQFGIFICIAKKEAVSN